MACRALGVSRSWFYKWKDGALSAAGGARGRRWRPRSGACSAAHRGTYGSPRITADLREAGWRVSENTVAAVMREQGLAARRKKKRRSTTRPGKGRWRAPDLIKRDFPAQKINTKWYGDGTEIKTGEGKLYLASVLDMASRRVLGFALGEHHDAAAGLWRAGHGGRGTRRPGPRRDHAYRPGQRIHRGLGPPGLPAADPSPSRWAGPAPRWTTRSSNPGTRPWNSSSARWSSSTPGQRPGPGSRTWIEDYNTTRRHSALGMMSPAGYEQALKAGKAA